MLSLVRALLRRNAPRNRISWTGHATAVIDNTEQLTADKDRNAEKTHTQAGHTDFASWLFRLLTWDGILPVGIILVPSAIEFVLPNRRGAVELAAVALPIAAFFFRAIVGSRHIASNNCSPGFRQLQYGALGLGIFVLVFIDCFAMLSHLMPKRPMLENVTLYAIAFSIYLTPMALAMYPGRAKPPPDVFRP